MLILVSIILAVAQVKKLLIPVNHLISASKRVAEGKQEEDLLVTDDDEIGELTSSFNIMSR